ncbi:non-ribosomal peptide synthetase [Paenarthrobacter sp. NPDC058040]|uniref:non-ribosomal peptide synthetase n=1 Tax=unclassified Paenarthrobacter TaxID=2634190 RepID=UPI0036DBEFC5
MYAPYELMNDVSKVNTTNLTETCLVTPDGNGYTWGQFGACVRAWRDWMGSDEVAKRVLVARLDLSLSSLSLMVAAVEEPVRIAWLPLGLPAARELEMIAELSEAAMLGQNVMLVDEALAERVAGSPQKHGVEYEDTRVGIDFTWNNDAKFIYFTSGSEGTPKAVQVGMRAIRNRIEWMWDQYPYEPLDRVVIQKPLSFVASYWEVLGSLLQGVTGILVSSAERSRPDRFFDAVADTAATHLFATPAALLGLAEIATDQGTTLTALKLVCSSADRLTGDVAQRFLEAAPRAQLLNLYGATETTANTTVFEVPRAKTLHDQLPLGRPIANTKIVIRDAQGHAEEAGQEGLICVQGAPVAEGYVVGGHVTDGGVFFGSEGADREIRTGDLGYVESGLLYLTGRADNAVNISGYKIHLEEIENAARKLAGVSGQCGALYRNDSSGEYLALVIPLEWEPHVTSQKLSELLPPYMVPQRIVPVASVPTVRTGKVDRSACLALTLEGQSPAQEEKPSGAAGRLHASVEKLWCAALGQGSQLSTGDFFAAGGDSLRAVRLLASLRQEFGVRIPLRGFYSDPTLTYLVELLGVDLSGAE